MIVDRIEDGFAVLEGDDGALEVPAAWLPTGAREGSVLKIEVERQGQRSRLTLTLDPEGQAARETDLRRLRDSVPEGPGGDIAL
jgi:hypothetical protein